MLGADDGAPPPRAPPSTYVCVLSKCPNSMLPLAHRSPGSLGYELRMRHLLDKRCWHRDWTKEGECAVHATSTNVAETHDRGCLKCVTGGLLDLPIIPRAAHVLDGDEGTYWRSAPLDEGPSGALSPCSARSFAFCSHSSSAGGSPRPTASSAMH